MYTNEMLDAIVAGLDSNKKDLEFHKLNLARYQSILSDDELEDGEFKNKIMAEIPILESRIKEVSLVIKHTELQLTGVSSEELEQSRQRILSK